jgi:plastocyanin
MRRDVTLLPVAALLAAWMVPSPCSAQIVLEGRVVNGGEAIQEAAVYLVPVGAEQSFVADEPMVIDQVHLSFTPAVAIVRPGTELVFSNSDDVLHNVFGPSDGEWAGFDLGTYPQDESRSHVFQRPGLNVVLCHVHPEMAMFVIVVPTTYRALSGPDGSFSLEGVPPGTYRLHAWHHRHWRNEYVTEITLTESVTDMTITLGRRGSPEQPTS